MPAADNDLVQNEGTILVDVHDGIATITLNRPTKFNSFDEAQTVKLNAILARCADAANVEAVIITGSGKYYSAGADFSSSVAPQWPSTMRAHITEYNQSVFDAYIKFPKPIVAAVNGPAIGMAVTSAAITDVIIAAPTASFHTPFVHLGLPPEGCSSFNFPHLMGRANAAVMLAKGEKIDAVTAKEFGLVKEVVEEDRLLERATEVAHSLKGSVRKIVQEGIVDRLLEVNAKKSVALGKAILEKPFLRANMKNATEKGKGSTAWVFWGLLTMHPIISRL